MRTKEKRQFTSISKIPFFSNVYRKMIVGETLNINEKTYMLSIALEFCRQYEKDKRRTSYVEFAYFVFLKYALTYKDYAPLYDFALNFGFYPIVKELQDKGEVEILNIQEFINQVNINEYVYDSYIETADQKEKRDLLLSTESNYSSFIAPTSFGKSSAIIDHIKGKSDDYSRFSIIVPTKSLLVQTYRNVRNANLGFKILTHDEMYTEDERFIAVMTQERALRLLDKHELYFDVMYIDEAHNLFEKNSRSILLARLIRLNNRRNRSQKIIYLSPLINDSNNLKLDFQDDIAEQRISINMKEAEIYEFLKDGNEEIYNRFSNQFYSLNNKYTDFWEYIFQKKSAKNFVYIKRPKEIERFAKELYNRLGDDEIVSPRIEAIVAELKDYVHEDFYMIDLIKKGIVYLHGKIPDLIKEYMEFQFKNNDDLFYIVSNMVILEGINLPIDRLFILNAHSLSSNMAINLIGRINRLNDIFGSKEMSLYKLLPQVYFINSEYNAKNMSMRSLITQLRSNINKDKVENPTLENFSIERVKGEQRGKMLQIIANEKLLSEEPLKVGDNIKQVLLKCGIEEYIKLNDIYLEKLEYRCNLIMNSVRWTDYNIIEKIYYFYLWDIVEEDVKFEIRRLENDLARKYYMFFFE
ncbi:DEAD/DEAH box helicase [Listeria grandensis]|uniref:DEAD/DEAH box helicase n=1 Tax=Listeria grandensis TaxID=1494963 RepID=UPI0004B98F17|nr:DEAD/DEAH box helicase [Listeria grandensis]